MKILYIEFNFFIILFIIFYYDIRFKRMFRSVVFVYNLDFFEFILNKLILYFLIF